MSQLRSGTGRPCPYPNLPAVGLMLSAGDVLYCLSSSRAWNDNAYAFAVLNAYVYTKKSRQKTNAEIHQKLAFLEGDVPPHFGPRFVELRQYYGLPQSIRFRGATARPSTTAAPARRASAAAPRPRATTNPRPAVARADDDGEELPPPPYTSEDPDPASTRLLQERLASESIIQDNRVSIGSFEAPPAAVSSSPQRTESLRQSTPPLPVSDHTNGPSNAAASSSTAPAPARQSSEMTDEERRAREESELEEAIRVSRMQEKERLEYERAVQASLASAQEDAVRRSVFDTDTPGAGPSTSNGDNRRASSYHRPAPGQLDGMRRAVSSTHQPSQSMGGQGYSPMPGGFQPQPVPSAGQGYPAMPGGYQQQFQSPQHLSAGQGYYGQPDSRQNQPATTENVMDMLGGLDFNSDSLPAPLAPQPTGHIRSQSTGVSSAMPAPLPALQSQPTGSALKSRNPFLTIEEREALSAQGEPQTGTAQPSNIPYSSFSANSSKPHGHSPLAAPERDLPAIPQDLDHDDSSDSGWSDDDVEEYASPQGPPPGWKGKAPAVAPASPPIPTSSGTAALPFVRERAARPLPTPNGPPALPPRSAMRDAAPLDAPVPHTPPTLNAYGLGGADNPSAIPAAAQSFHTSTSTPFQNPAGQSSTLPAMPILDKAGENALEMLREYDTVFLVDDSTSMAGERWQQAMTAIMGVVVQAIRYDDDGVDVYFLNSKRVGKGLHSAEDVEELFAGLEPKGATPTGLRLEAILRDYMARLERATADGAEAIRPMSLIVVTDGAFATPVIHRLRACASDPSLDRVALVETAPTDDPESVIIAVAKRLDRGDYPLSQVGVQLLQIGDDVEAREALQELDDGLAAAHGVRDMVDTVPYNGSEMTAELIIKVLLGGINRRLDRRGAR